MKMKRQNSLFVLGVLVAFGGVGANADTINGGGSWATVNQSQLYGYTPTSNYTNYYWNNYSPDGHPDPSNQANVGWCVTGSSQCSIANPAGDGNVKTYVNAGSLGSPGAASYSPSNVTNGTAVNNMYFTSSGMSTPVKLEGSLTNQNGTNGQGHLVFGYYVTSGTGTMMGSPTALFDSQSATIGSLATISVGAGQGYGFYLENIQGSGGAAHGETDYWFYMNDSMDHSTGTLAADTNQHFAAFSSTTSPGSYYVGAYGSPECSTPGSGQNYTPANSPCAYISDWDYNSFIVAVGPISTATPEPASMALMGLGLVLAALGARKFAPRRAA